MNLIIKDMIYETASLSNRKLTTNLTSKEMRFLLLYILILPLSLHVFAQETSLIPMPQNIKWGEGSFTLSPKTTLSKGNSELDVDYYIQEIQKQNNVSITETDKEYGDITLHIINEFNLGEEAYKLTVQESSIDITANTEFGLRNGLATLLQLIGLNNTVKCVDISDSPKYEWRGMMLDVSRHFFTVEEVKRYLDLMTKYKLNKFHWHLTEDQGWRIEIKKYPKLTEIGAWRTERDGSRYGGFYTQDDIKEVVAYATARGIEVIPEIDMPGHMLGALASYPELACTEGPFEVWNRWGVSEDVLCAGDEQVYTFIEDILEEIIPLFPSTYFHLGGDECPKTRWKECDKCQLKIKQENLADEHELQSYFIHRVEKMVNKLGKKITGWDEILEGGLSSTATVQLWRDWHDKDAVSKIAKMGNDVIASPTACCYFDYDIATTDVAQLYAFNPTPSDLNKEEAQHVLGSEFTVWTERIPDQDRADFMIFPRALAFSEALWTGTKENGLKEFEERLDLQYPILDQLGVNYGPSEVLMEVSTSMKDGDIMLSANKLSDKLEIKYKVGSKGEFQLYTKPVKVEKSGDIIFQGFRNGKALGDPILKTFQLHKGNSASIKLIEEPSKPYINGGAASLNNSIIGGEKFQDGTWIGFNGQNLQAVLTWEESQELNSITFDAYDELGSWIMSPNSFKVLVSIDGSKYKDVSKKFKVEKVVDLNKNQFTLKFKKPLKEVRGIEIIIEHPGVLPKNHGGAGKPAWMMIDELIIE
ncbi:family 20 glycosylhydrolase [Flammeovirga yaeyamensis]|uniref:beta-N-acetylhexosaminidase n=1 Tax=Flammeovirga yaeyamensis TaxID=367791 RepID=A0AAX1MY45_9BACT|nr:beta-N-acetylhexosaminidase [Flammeovirga yaeyamensis]MBB3696260.1 hexosaminidase [Flammeovirga yaeyamensis]QWG00234.1 family 20 glycosylhydrolase [Flammeovirga yaeyamensis]